MKKINILVIPPDYYGVSYYRLINPYKEIQIKHPDEFNIEINQTVNFNDTEYLKKFDIIHGHRTFVDFAQMDKLTALLKSLGIITILDIDDFWSTGKHHPMYHIVKNQNLDIKVPKALASVDFVTTTTDYFANIIKNYNKNVMVFPNAVDPNDKNFVSKKEENLTDRLRVTYLGGSSHLADVKLLSKSFEKINKAHSDKIQWVLCGFDTRGTVSELNEKTGVVKDRPILPAETCWAKYEELMTSDYMNMSEEYKHFLLKYKNEDFKGVAEESYRRVWTKPFSTYATNYNLADVSLAPLEKGDGLFNSAKSQLKVIEAGFHKMPIIASDIEPYKIDIVHGVNGFLVNNNSGIKGWDYYINYFIQNPEKVKEMGQALYETVKDKYDIKNVSEDRVKWLKQIVDGK